MKHATEKMTQIILAAAMAFDSATARSSKIPHIEGSTSGKSSLAALKVGDEGSKVISMTGPNNFNTNPIDYEPIDPDKYGKISIEMLRLQSNIAILAEKSSGIQAVYIHEIGKDPADSAKYNEDQMLLGASVMKVPIVITTMKILEEKGIDYKTYKSPLSGTPIEIMFDEIITQHNNIYSRELLNLIEDMGYDITSEILKMGVENVDMRNKTISAKSMGDLLEKLATDSLGIKNNDYILSLLSSKSLINDMYFPWAVNNTLRSVGRFDNIVGSLYQVNEVVPGIGSVISVSNDTGILTTNDGRKFTIVILGNYQPGYNEDDENIFIPEISNLLIDHIAKK